MFSSYHKGCEISNRINKKDARRRPLFGFEQIVFGEKRKRKIKSGRKEEFEGETIRVSTLIKIMHQIKKTPEGVLFYLMPVAGVDKLLLRKILMLCSALGGKSFSA